MYIRQRAVALGKWLVAEMPLRVLLWLGNGIAITHLRVLRSCRRPVQN